MGKTYNGNDKIDNFFAHYGRKGMKRGMNIFNPDYNPIGEKAQGGNLKAAYRHKIPTKADKERAAMNRAASASSTLGAANIEKARRDALLEAERKRQSAYNKERYTGETKPQKSPDTKTAAGEVIGAIKSGIEKAAKENGYDINAIEETRKGIKDYYDSLRPSEKGYAIKANQLLINAMGLKEKDLNTLGLLGDTDFMSYMNIAIGMAAGHKGLSVDEFLKQTGATDEQIKERTRAAVKGDQLTQKRIKNEERNAALKKRGLMPKGNVSNEYLDELEYNSRR